MNRYTPVTNLAKRDALKARAIGPDACAIARFSSFLEERSCTYWGENELGQVLPIRKTKPDFFVRTSGNSSALVELESFEKVRFTSLALGQNSVMSGLNETDNKRFSTALQHACQQLKHYRDMGFPSLVVMDDFRQIGIPVNVDILGLHLLRWFDGNTERNHVSAVAWLLGEQPSVSLRVFHNPRASYALAASFFDSTDDEYWEVQPGEFWKRKP